MIWFTNLHELQLNLIAWLNHGCRNGFAIIKKEQLHVKVTKIVFFLTVNMTHMDGIQYLHSCFASILFVEHFVDFPVCAFSNCLNDFPCVGGIRKVVKDNRFSWLWKHLDERSPMQWNKAKQKQRRISVTSAGGGREFSTDIRDEFIWRRIKANCTWKKIISTIMGFLSVSNVMLQFKHVTLQPRGHE